MRINTQIRALAALAAMSAVLAAASPASAGFGSSPGRCTTCLHQR